MIDRLIDRYEITILMLKLNPIQPLFLMGFSPFNQPSPGPRGVGPGWHLPRRAARPRGGAGGLSAVGPAGALGTSLGENGWWMVIGMGY